MGIPPIRKARLRYARTVDADPVEQERRVQTQIAFFKRAVGSFAGKVVAEIGPGDAIPLASYVLDEGAIRYIAIDRFMGAFVEERPGIQIHRVSIEEGANVKADIIVSYNVLEHLSDLRTAFRNMERILNPRGVMAHRIDYGPHDVWTQHPDKFFFRTFPGWLWRIMGSNRGYPNRVRHTEVMRLLEEAGFKTTATVTGTFAGEPLDAELLIRH